MKTIIFIASILVSFSLNAQTLKGYVKGKNKEKKEIIPGAYITWEGLKTGVQTDKNGYFEIAKSKSNKLIVSYVGYKTDTINVTAFGQIININLLSNTKIETISIKGKSNSQFYSSSKIELLQTVTGDDLTKLPCCNLSESFENNASVDVSYADAISGSKQIRMLGLSGIYSQIMVENMPAVRGLSTKYGLSFVPGSWMESIQISKGAATVINGYESATGQINVELKKPENSERLFVNLYTNSELKTEANLTAAIPVTDKISTMFLFFGSNLSRTFDHNNDGFQDMPKTNQFNVLNRWKYNGKSLKSQFGIRAMQDKRHGGQINYLTEGSLDGGNYGIETDTKLYEAFAKLGFTFKRLKNTSVGSQFSGTYHKSDLVFGNKTYSGLQKTFYTNIILETRLKHNHKINVGASYIYDNYDEVYLKMPFVRSESVPGIFTQYTYNYNNKLNVIAGIRSDFNSKYGTFITPRLHMKYNISDNLSFRASAGKAYRTANIFAENQAIMASSRKLIISEEFKPEQAWNYGVSITYKKSLPEDKGYSFSGDFYRTDFVNQVIADINSSPTEINFYNLNGKSYANNAQIEASVTPIKRFDILAAFRVSDVKTTVQNELINKPFVNSYRGLLTLSYATRFKKWSFDITNQFIGSSALPSFGLEIAGNISTKSPAYYILHAQVTRKFKHFSVYAGGENLTGYKQENPIISADNPFGDTFDASMIWGPVMGRVFYAGVRIYIK